MPMRLHEYRHKQTYTQMHALSVEEADIREELNQNKAYDWILGQSKELIDRELERGEIHPLRLLYRIPKYSIQSTEVLIEALSCLTAYMIEKLGLNILTVTANDSQMGSVSSCPCEACRKGKSQNEMSERSG